MKLFLLSVLLAGLAFAVNGLAPQKQVLITFPNDTPESALSNAKSSIEEAVSCVNPYNELSTHTSREGRANIIRVR